MIDKTTSDILLEERIAQIDDINFDKIYDIDDFATKEMENFEQITDFDAIQFVQSNAADYTQDISTSVSAPAFEMDIQPNEFLDKYVWNNQEDEVTEVKKEKFKVSNKPLLFTFTSIAVLLCILFIYNVFVINSLEKTVASTAASINATNSNVEIEVVLEKGMFTIKDSKLYRHIDGDFIEIAEDERLSGAKHYYGASHGKLINKYYDCLINNSKDYVHIKDAIPSIKMIDSIRQSSESRKTILWEDILCKNLQ